MQNYQREFIQYAIDCEVLRFGECTLKSGRTSPYFFNTGLFSTGARLSRLGSFYAQALLQSGIKTDVLYGPAYKGIPLVCATAMALAKLKNEDIPFAFNRKEEKDHGEGGKLVGADLHGSVVIVDDVITAGTSVRESINLIRCADAKPSGVLIAVDRQEKGRNERSAINEVQAIYKIPVVSVITLSDIVLFLEEAGGFPVELADIKKYQTTYGISSIA